MAPTPPTRPVAPHPFRRMAVALLVVLLLAEVGARGLGAVLPEPRTWYHDIAQAKAEQVKGMRGAELDVLFAGTSQTYYGIDPAIIDAQLGTASYNAGVPAGVPPIQERWLLDEVLRRVDADTVVWGLSLLDLNEGRDLAVVSSYDEAQATRRGVLPEVDRLLSRWSGLFRHRRQLTDPDVWALAVRGHDPIAATRSLLRSDGLRIAGDRQPTEAERIRIQNQVIGDYRPGGRMLESLRGTISAVRERGSDVVLVWLPVPERLVELLPDEGQQREAAQVVARLARELGVELIDVSDGFSNGDFLDYTHLAPSGAERLSRRLAGELASTLGSSPPPRRR